MNSTAALRGDSGTPMQSFCPNPAFSFAPISIANSASVTFGSTGTPDHDITNMIAISFTPNGDLTRYFNADTTKTRTIKGDVENILVLHKNAETITVTNSTGSTITLEVEGM